MFFSDAIFICSDPLSVGGANSLLPSEPKHALQTETPPWLSPTNQSSTKKLLVSVVKL